MKSPLSIGLSFGLTSGVITTLGMIVGLNASTHSEVAVIGGILTVALADSFSDALGMHITEESDSKSSQRFTWETTAATFLFKMLFGLSFVIPFVLLDYDIAVICSILWGLSVISLFSFRLGLKRKENPWRTTGEHLSVSIFVIIITQFLGMGISRIFN
jgi:VIT1/CCC1 family predicted Fe2+/Mn2+ transporter